MKDRSHLNWTRGRKSFALHIGKFHHPFLHVVPDNRWSQMWRIRRRDNSLADLLNLARAEDAAQSHALGEPQVRAKAGKARKTRSARARKVVGQKQEATP